MKVSVVFVFVLAVACASADSPPIPYTAAAAAAAGNQQAAFAGERIHTVGEQYVDHFGSDGFNVQSGYEGYLIPAGGEGHVFPFAPSGLDLKGHHGIFVKLLKNIVALGSKVVPKVALGAAVLVGLFVLGGCVNALICTFTPFCTISFLGFGVTKDTMRSYLTPDRISTTASFVMDAIKKYKDMYETSSNDIDAGKTGAH